MWRKNFFVYLFSLFLCAVVGACASPDGGEAGSTCAITSDCMEGLECRAKRCRTPLKREAPLIRAFALPKEVEVGFKVLLDAKGSESRDFLATELTFKWTIKTKPEKSKATIEDATSHSASFKPDIAGNYVFTVAVTSGKDKEALTSTADVKLTATAPTNRRPVAVAGGDQLVVPGTVVKLDGSLSRDPDGDRITFQWEIKSRPSGSKSTLSDSGIEKPTLKVDIEGRFILSLVVTDERGEPSLPDTITIEVLIGADKTPKLTKISPNSGEDYQLKWPVKLTGSDFVKGAKVRIGRHDFVATYKSDTSLEATLNLALIGAGKHDVQVFNTNGKLSTPPLTFTVSKAKEPKITSLTPDYGHIGGKVKVTIKGENFIKGHSQVLFLTTPMPSTIKSSTEIDFEVDLTNTAIGNYPIKIINPGNRSSNEVTFHVRDKLPRPELRVLNPPSGVTDSQITFSVHGIGFGEGAVIMFEGKAIPSKRVSRDEVTANPHLDLKGITPGLYNVWVLNPDKQPTNKIKFRVREKDPTPKLNRILPFSIYLNEVKDDLGIYGQDFAKGVRLFIGQNEITGAFGKVTWRSDSYLVAKVDLRDTTKWTSGDFQTYVMNPNGKKSNIFNLTISYRIPSIDSIIPSSWTTKCPTEIEIRGRNFIPTSKVLFGSFTFSKGSTTHPITFMDDKTIKFKLNTSNMASSTYSVIIDNGPKARSQSTKFVLSSAFSQTPYISYSDRIYGASNTKVSVRISTASGKYESIKPGAIVLLGGKKHKTSCSTSSLGTYCYNLTAELDLTGYKPGVYDLVVSNPCDIRSSAIAFTVGPAPTPYITSFKPSFAKVGDKTKIKILGAHFAKGYTISWAGKDLPTTFISGKELETTDAIDFSKSTVGEISVYIKDSNGTLTKEYKFSVVGGFVPIITEVSGNVQPAGQILKPLTVKGSGFVLTSTAYIGGKLATTFFKSSSEIEIRNFDTSGMKEGIQLIQVVNNTRKSNFFPLYLQPPVGPMIRYLNPSTVVANSTSSLSMTVYVSNVSTSPRASLIIKDPDGKILNVNSYWSTSSFYSSYIRGTFNIGSLEQGRYTFQVKNPNGLVSNPGIFTISPPPDPVLTRLYPLDGYRGNPAQFIHLYGLNFAPKDVVIFNNDTSNRIPIKVKAAGLVEVAIDLSKTRYAGTYEIYVLRCQNKACTKTFKTKPVQFIVKDPPCSAISCTYFMPPLNSEACDTATKVCKPVCKTTADCTKLDSKAKWTCQQGFCK